MESAVHTSTDNLAAVWASVYRLCSGLPDSQWDLPTGCPGWTVKDHVSRLVDYEARALGRPAPQHDPGPLPHVRNELGRANEIGVDMRRAQSGAAVLAEFRQVTGGRGRPAAGPQGATVTMTIPAATFAALAGGRSDMPGNVAITGDQQLGQRVLQSMGLMP
jgi:hypothetical protein